MADIAIAHPAETLASAAFTASTPSGGDKLTGAIAGQPVFLEINNGHSAAITVSLVPTDTDLVLLNVGKVTKPGISVSVPAAGQYVACIPGDVVSRYLDVNGKIPITYTSGNAALLVRAVQHAG